MRQSPLLAGVSALAVMTAALALAKPAEAVTIAALSSDNTLSLIDTDTRKVVRTVRISGVPATILGVDVRPADGLLYALAADGTIATVDPLTGKSTIRTKLETMLPAGVKAVVDFNPVADRLRVMGADGTNLRANVDDGKVAVDGRLRYADTDDARGRAPMVTAGAYSGSFKGTTATALYDIDGATWGFLRQAPPNDGVLNTIAKVNLPATADIAFDIQADEKSGDQGWLLAGGSLFNLDIATGALSAGSKIAGLSTGIRDIAVLPVR